MNGIAVNHAPVAVSDSYAVKKNTTLTVAAARSLLTNDSDPDGDEFTITEVGSTGLSGTLSLDVANGTFTYTPATDFVGEETFQYRISDDSLESELVTVTIDVAAAIGITAAYGFGFEGGDLHFVLGAIAFESSITNYEVDVNNDGTYDCSGTHDATYEGALILDVESTLLGNPVDNGTYSAKLRVSLANGVQREVDFEILIDNLPPEISIEGDDEVEVGTTYTLTLSGSDPGPDAPTFTVYWGDGDTEETSDPNATLIHTYIEEGDYDIVVVASDETDSEWTNHIVTVNSYGPTLESTSASIDGEQLNVVLTVNAHSDATVDTIQWDTDGDGGFDDATGDSVNLNGNVAAVDFDAAAEISGQGIAFWAHVLMTDSEGRTSKEFLAFDSAGNSLANIANPFLADAENDFLTKRGTLRSGSFPASSSSPGYLKGTTSHAGLQEVLPVVGQLFTTVIINGFTDAALAIIPWTKIADGTITVSIRTLGWWDRLVMRRPGLILQSGSEVLHLTYEQSLLYAKHLGVGSHDLTAIKTAIEEFAQFATTAKNSRAVNVTFNQAKDKINHARAMFGMSNSQSAANVNEYINRITNFCNDPNTKVIPGIYAVDGTKKTFFVNETTKKMVMRAADGSFHSCWELSDKQLQYVLTRGCLGGR